MKVQNFKHNFTLVGNPLEHNIKIWDFFSSLEICPLQTPKAHFSVSFILKFAQKKKKAVK
jgi:hypothetical protein